ncbi:UBX domain protein [Lineolata rhizophorae]|uniref:UBX domain protein n=1 Tax=Lineolata rhizophorae TaxID=578093 RepID=A0A6A6PDW9_9PEZI|nr:UBX domain protein [Lineolata rhizophorae]
MATPSVDITALTDDQRQALEQFAAVTDQPIESAVPLLQRCQWNVQVAVSRFFDGEPPDPVTEGPGAASVPPPRQTSRRQETLIDGASSFARSSSQNSDLEPAPRVVPQPESQVSQQAPVLLSLVLVPFNILYTAFSKVFGFLGHLFPFLPRLLARMTTRSASAANRRNTSGRRPLNPRDTAARFIREFEEEYGPNELPFQEMSYAQSYDKAKKELRFLLVVLLSPEHDDTASFVRETLLSPEVVQFLKNPQHNILLWGGNVQDAEAYQISAALKCTKLPFSGLIAHTPSVSSSAMSVVRRIPGPMAPDSYLSKLRTAISQNSEALDRVRAQRAEQQATRNLREEQNSAYERSLAQDRERTRQRREAEEARRRAEQEAKEKEEAKEREAQKLKKWKRWRAQFIAPEPSADVKGSVRISLRMPSGERVVRKFAPDAAIEDLYAFVECYDLLQGGDLSISEKAEEPSGFKHEYKFILVSPIPRQEYDVESGGFVKDRIGPSGNLIVERTELDDDEDEE